MNCKRNSITIYALVDEKGVYRYVGKTKGEPKERLSQHLNEARRRKVLNRRTNWIWHQLKNQMPVDLVVLETSSAHKWEEAEKGWIAYGKAQGWPLLNHTDGGEGRSMPLSSETRIKISKSLSGHPVSEETRNKISLSVQQHFKENPEAGNDIKIRLTGKKQTQETKKARSESMRRFYEQHPEARTRQAENGCRRVVSIETRNKISRALMNHEVSETSRMKMSQKKKGVPWGEARRRAS